MLSCRLHTPPRVAPPSSAADLASQSGAGAEAVANPELWFLYRDLAEKCMDTLFRSGRQYNLSREELLAIVHLRVERAGGGDVGAGVGGEVGEVPCRVGLANKRIMFADHLATALDSGLFECEMASFPPVARVHFTGPAMSERARSLMQFMVDAGTLPDMGAAGSWMADAIRDELTNPFSEGPAPCSIEAAIGFLRALHEQGARVEIDPEERRQRFDGDKSETLALWYRAVDLFNAEKSMEQVYSDHELQRDTAASVSRPRAARTRRVL